MCLHTYIVIDCPHRIPPLGTPAKHHQSNCTIVTTPCQVPDTIMRTGTGKAIPSHSHISTDITVQVITVHIEAAPDHDIGIITTTTGVAHNTQIPHTGVIAIDPTMTHHMDHTIDHPCTEGYHTTPGTKVNCVHVCPTNPQDKIHIGHTHTPADHKANHITRTPE